ncbi:MAG: hypothetical protein EOO77_30815 [Oxalobacteraceae bacterium]|nr:MAG: hypothetical protein EOO77_30815 [Oxalobacteraceae bacterium]
MKTRKDGYREFRSETQPDTLAKLASKHEPPTLMVACSDSRVSPSVVTKAELGSLFLVRTAGNTVSPSSRGVHTERFSIIYAVSVLKVREIIVMGHSRCGAMGALVNPAETKTPEQKKAAADLEEVTRGLTSHCKPVIDAVRKSKLPKAQLQSEAARINVQLQLSRIAKIPCVKEAVAAKTLNLHGWFFEIETGTMYEADPKSRKFLPVDWEENEQLLATASKALETPIRRTASPESQTDASHASKRTRK